MYFKWKTDSITFGPTLSKGLKKSLTEGVLKYIRKIEDNAWETNDNWFIEYVIIDEVVKWETMNPNEYGVWFNWFVRHNEGEDNKRRFATIHAMSGRSRRKKARNYLTEGN